MPFLHRRKSTKLSSRWGQLFNAFLVDDQAATKASSPTLAGENDSPHSLHEFMRHTLAQREHNPRSAECSRILFVSEDNAARTQIASAYARFLGGEKVFVRSVGTSPAFQVDPLVIEVLKERGVPTEDLKPKTFNPHTVDRVDEVIIFGETTTIDSHAQTWEITKDTSDKQLVHYMCDEVETHVRNLLLKLGIEPKPHTDMSPEFMAA
ncbi:phosphotyrosine protein phosphatase [Corynebacterium felinum]|uniref:Protein-tyrosine-phosphatase n=1 Tax=Corynebacterium felinum TaxID=131318 RepID=A0ABU2B5U3_9CORY|nr:phosphotyrosine protein phosphatase [Corynebacterium felinum]MDF5821730.1 phosphotyrosine protein phosphatase [Corynebacterium felinum]MDR7353979.1 protein-tyrosine-phosphatase [Corynebacterium felinum]WJY96152.1 Arsenate-mycothiol transferase ArsC2 [Corynebacterium felinum]